MEYFENDDSLFDIEDDSQYSDFINIDLIIDLFYDFESRFKFSSPFFLSKLKSQYLTDFIYGNFQHNLHINQKMLKYFSSYYYSEIEISYNIFIGVVEKLNFKTKIKKSDWIVFCLLYTNLYELGLD